MFPDDESRDGPRNVRLPDVAASPRIFIEIGRSVSLKLCTVRLVKDITITNLRRLNL